MNDAALTGKQMAILVGVAALLPGWSFAQPRARAIAAATSAEGAEAFADAVGDMVRRRFTTAGLWPGEFPWSVELIGRRAALSGEIPLSTAEARVAMAALEACAVEFADTWWEFLVVAPGDLEKYGTSADDLWALREVIRSVAGEVADSPA